MIFAPNLARKRWLTIFIELRERDEEKYSHLTEEIERLKAKVAAAEQLEQENRSLKENLAKLMTGSEISPKPTERMSSTDLDNQQSSFPKPRLPAAPRNPLGESSPSIPQTVSKSDAGNSDVDWELEYKVLWTHHQKASDRLQATRSKARVFKEAHEKWENYALFLEKKLKRLKKSTRGLAAKEGSAAPEHGVSPSVPVEALGKHHTVESSTQSTEKESEDKINYYAELPPLPRDSASSDAVLMKQEPSSDVPIMVSERCVRKRKHADDDSAEPARRIKRESSDDASYPIITSTSVFFSPQESMDLDAGPRIQTPRKARQRAPVPVQLHQIDGATDEREGTGDAMLVLPDIHDAELEPSRLLAKPSVPNAKQHLDLDSPNMSRSRRGAGHDRRKLHHGIMSVTEDGQILDGSSYESTAMYRGRLDALLNGPNPASGEDAILERPARVAPVTPRPPIPEILDLNAPRRELPWETSAAKRGKTTPSVALGELSTALAGARQAASNLKLGLNHASSGKKVQGRLRKLPLPRLNLTDFKVNPEFNEGLNCAFSEVVRGKADRAELPGCTDEACCGKNFRDMALNERDAAGPLLLQQTSHINLLEEYLGEDAHRLGSMTRQEKEGLWVEARVRDLANRFGKHKHRYTRAPSPAALWNVDMPNTQELAKEKEEMRNGERKQVEERYRDALRGNGRWLFRDE